MNETEPQIKKSKSQVKRELQALQELGKRLVALPDKNLKCIPMTDALRDAVLDAKKFRREALRRQLQHIGALMRHEDVDSIHQALTTVLQPHAKEVRGFHEVEQWREALLAGDHEQLDSLCRRFPHADRKHIQHLIQDAIQEKERNKPPKSARSLFRYLAGLRDDP